MVSYAENVSIWWRHHDWSSPSWKTPLSRIANTISADILATHRAMASVAMVLVYHSGFSPGGLRHCDLLDDFVKYCLFIFLYTVSIGSGNGSVPNRRRTINWTSKGLYFAKNNDDTAHPWGLNGLTSRGLNTHCISEQATFPRNHFLEIRFLHDDSTSTEGLF